MTDAELEAWREEQVQKAIEADKAEIAEYIESGDLDRDIEADFAEREAKVAEMEKSEAEKNKAQ